MAALSMTLARLILLCLVCFTGTCKQAYAHPVPFTYIDVHPESGAVDISVVMHTFDIAHDLNVQPAEKLLETDTLAAQRDAIAALLRP